MSDPQIGFCAWNDFQVAQHYHLARRTPGAEMIVYPNATKAQRVSDGTMAQIDLPIRVLPNAKDLSALASEYTAYVFQNRPPAMAILASTKVVMLQYSMAKAATAYNLRWGTADLGLVYGDYSAEIVHPMCPVAPIGNPRLDPYFQNDLCFAIEAEIAAQLDPTKPTILYAPTWGDLSSVEEYSEELIAIADDCNVLLHPHHLHAPLAQRLLDKLLITTNLPGGIDQICYLLKLSDAVVSDYSGSGFDALAVGKPLILLNVGGVSAHSHKKLHERGLEFEHRDQLGAVVHNPGGLRRVLQQVLDSPPRISDERSALRDRCFSNRGTSSHAGAREIMRLLEGRVEKSEAQQYLSHGIVESFLAAELRSRRLRSTRLALTRANKESAKYKKKAISDARYKLRSVRLARRLPTAAKASAKRVIRYALSKSSILQALRRRMPDYRARRSVILANLYQKGIESLQSRDYVTARLQFMKILELDPEQRDAHYNLFIIKSCAGEWLEATHHREKAGMLGHVGDEPTRFLCRNGMITEALMSAERFRARAEETKPRGLRGFRVLTAAFPFPDRERVYETRRVVDIVLAEIERGSFDNFKRLIQLGFLSDVASSASKHGNGEILSYVDKIYESTREIEWLLKAGGDNELLLESQRTVHDVTTGASLGTAKNFTGNFVELFVPDSFLSPFGEDGWGGPRLSTLQMWCSILRALSELDLVIVPRLQTSFYARSSRTSLITVTHHTVGSLERNLRVKLSAFPGFFTMDPKGYSGWAGFRAELGTAEYRKIGRVQAEDHWKQIYSQFVLQGVTKFPQSGGAARTKADYIFVPLQVADDTVSALSYMSQDQLLSSAVEGAARAGLSVVTKRHPLCKSYRVQQLLEDLQELPFVEVSDAPIHALISNSVGVVTVNSGVGFEALVHLKPVITVGAADYDAATTQVTNPDELIEVISNRRWEELDVVDRKKWLSHVFTNVLVENGDVESVKRRILFATSSENDTSVSGSRLDVQFANGS